jgi:hypothetical protein
MIAAAALRSTAFDGPPPAFLIRGAHITSNNPECRVQLGEPYVSAVANLAERERAEPQWSHLTTLDPDREAALAQLADIAAKHDGLAQDVERLREKVEEAKDGRGTGGLAMTIQLRRLFERHNLSLEVKPLPLAAPVEAASLRLMGWAATPDIDATRTAFRAGCFGESCSAICGTLPLLLKHDPNIVAGTIDRLEADSRGALLVTATVTHPLAMRMPGFSIGCAVRKFTVHNPDSVTFYAEVEEAVLQEISLVDQPANRRATVTERWQPNAVDRGFQEMLDRVRRMRDMIAAEMAA